jgi:hypothetical protein
MAKPLHRTAPQSSGTPIYGMGDQNGRVPLCFNTMKSEYWEGQKWATSSRYIRITVTGFILEVGGGREGCLVWWSRTTQVGQTKAPGVERAVVFKPRLVKQDRLSNLYILDKI